MSDKTARTHTHVSNRAKARQDADRKVVFKSVLENPFRIQWPSVPVNAQNRFLAALVNMADGILEYRHGWVRERRKRKRAQKHAHLESANVSKKIKVVSGMSDDAMKAGDVDGSATIREGAESFGVMGHTPAMEVATLAAEDQVQLEPPSMLQHLTIGINEVTRKLESQIKLSRQTVIISDKCAVSSEYSQPRIKVVFVCRADIDPPILVDHLPHLISTCNSLRRPLDIVKLVPLPKGAEFTLAAAMGLRRVAVIAVDSTTPELSSLDSLLESVPTLSASWLMPAHKSSGRRAEDLVPTHIKQVRTSAPKDMKASREQRVKGRAAAKERAKERIKKERKLKSVKVGSMSRVMATATRSTGGQKKLRLTAIS